MCTVVSEHRAANPRAMQYETPAAANARGIELRAQGHLTEAIEAFRAGAGAFPSVLELHQNLAHTLYETGDNLGAIAAYAQALALDPGSVATHLALFELYQITGDPQRALSHQRHALERQQLFSSFAPHEARSVLLLCAPGDWQANIPVDFLFDRATTTVHKLYIIDDLRLKHTVLPSYDVMWNIIAESPEALPYLQRAARLFAAQDKPTLNAPANVLAISRTRLPETLDGSGAFVAPIADVNASDLRSGQQPFDYPIIVRPVGSHAGHGLEKIDDAQALPAYVDREVAQAYFVNPFIDYRSGDGYFRKYRVIFVDGEPFPCHLAISPRWMIHYYNAAMAENAWMREEEGCFLADVRAAFDGERFEALTAIAQSVGLEYFGIDCTIALDGRILVFEADPAMLVHTSDPIELYPYKHRYIPRIYRAVEQMIDRRKSADT